MYHPVWLSACRSAAFSPFMICSRALPPAPELFVLQNGEAPSPHSSRLPLLPPPSLGNHHPASRALGIGLPQGPPKSRILQDLSFPGWLLSLSRMSSGLVLGAHPRCSQCQDCFPFSGWRVFPSRGWTASCLSVPRSMDTWVFPPLTVVDHAALNMGVQTSESLFSVLGVHTQR